MQYINGKLGYTQWAWGDTKELLIVTLDRDGNVWHWSSIVRRRNGRGPRADRHRDESPALGGVPFKADVTEPSSGPASWHSDWTFGHLNGDLLPCLCGGEPADDGSVRDEGVNDEGQSWGLVSDEGHHN